jgi:hypothetical protein
MVTTFEYRPRIRWVLAAIAAFFAVIFLAEITSPTMGIAGVTINLVLGALMFVWFIRTIRTGIFISEGKPIIVRTAVRTWHLSPNEIKRFEAGVTTWSYGRLSLYAVREDGKVLAFAGEIPLSRRNKAKTDELLKHMNSFLTK